MHLNIPTLRERIAAMNDEQLEELADGESLAMTDSSRLEGLVLDQNKIRIALLDGYRKIQVAAHSQSTTDDQ